MHTNSTLKRFRFIPFRKSDISKMCLLDDSHKNQQAEFKKFYQLLDNVLSFESHQHLEVLKDAYASVDPDADTRQPELIEPTSDKDFTHHLQTLLEQANYERISQQEINQSLEMSSLFKIRLHVNFDDFTEVLLFCRGESIRTETIYRFMRWFPKTIEFINYDRVVLYIRVREDLEPNSLTMPDCKPASALLKLFQNVPKGDLEMLFPNTSIRMRTLDKLLIGVPAVISGGIVLTTKVGTSLLLLGSLVGFWFGISDQPVELNKTTMFALMAGFGALAGYIWKQFSSFRNRKLRFMQLLTQNLYFKNLDNNAGVFHRLISDAQDEECKEAILAYYFLFRNQEALTANQLDLKIEQWFEQQWQCSIDFEIEDALDKLVRLELVNNQQGHFSAVDLPSAIQILDRRWDGYLN